MRNCGGGGSWKMGYPPPLQPLRALPISTTRARGAAGSLVRSSAAAAPILVCPAPTPARKETASDSHPACRREGRRFLSPLAQARQQPLKLKAWIQRAGPAARLKPRKDPVGRSTAQGIASASEARTSPCSGADAPLALPPTISGAAGVRNTCLPLQWRDGTCPHPAVSPGARTGSCWWPFAKHMA